MSILFYAAARGEGTGGEGHTLERRVSWNALDGLLVSIRDKAARPAFVGIGEK